MELVIFEFMNVRHIPDVLGFERWPMQFGGYELWMLWCRNF